MCSIGEDDFGDEGGAHTMLKDPITPVIENDEICKKCNVNKSEIKVDLKNSMCKSCFLNYVRHKFRATLGSTKIVQRNSKVLIDFSGGIENICLIHMIQYGLDQETFKRLCIEPELIYIDDYFLTSTDSAARLENIKKLLELLIQIGNLRCHYVSIGENIIEAPKSLKEISMESITSKSEDEQAFVKHFASLKSLTAKQDFANIRRNLILRNIANKFHIKYVFLSDTSLTLAKRLLTNISLGRGSSVASDVGFSDDRGNVNFIRPIKDLNFNEIKNYVEISDLRYRTSEQYGINEGKSASIQNLTSNFIEGLQKNYSSTVSTVYRTCSKLAPKNEKIDNRCKICQSSLDFEDSETIFATEFSRIVSQIGGKGENSKNLTMIEDQAKSALCNSNSGKNSLCHGCKNIFIGIDDEDLNKFGF